MERAKKKKSIDTGVGGADAAALAGDLESAIESFDLRGVAEVLERARSSSNHQDSNRSGSSSGSSSSSIKSRDGCLSVLLNQPLPRSGLSPPCAAVVLLRKWQRALSCALLTAPDGVKGRLIHEKKEFSGLLQYPLRPYQDSKEALEILSEGEPGLVCLVRYWALCGGSDTFLEAFGTLENGESDGETVLSGKLGELIGGWTAVMLHLLLKEGADMDVPGRRCGGMESEGGWTIMHYACSSAHGVCGLARWLLHLKLPGSAEESTAWAVQNLDAQTGVFQLAPIHLAAVAGGMSSKVVADLINLRCANEKVRDIFGRTPQSLSEATLASMPVGVSSARPTLISPADKSVNAENWNESYRSADDDETSAHLPQPNNGASGVIVAHHCGASSSSPEAMNAGGALQQLACLKFSETLNRDAFLLDRPIILRNVDISRVRTRWSKDRFLTTYGFIPCDVSTVPFSDGYGGEKPTSMKLSDFCSSWASCKDHEAGSPLYLFSKVIPREYPALLEDIDLPEYLLPFVDAELSHTLYIGPKGSGAPLHDHTAAWNLTVYGYKAWYFLDPRSGITSRRPLSEWDEAQLQRAGCVTCIQGPGDVVLVPSHWTHAVKNLSETIGMAGEVRADAFPPPTEPIFLLSGRRES